LCLKKLRLSRQVAESGRRYGQGRSDFFFIPKGNIRIVATISASYDVSTHASQVSSLTGQA
jgi:hypothetical protein